MFHLISINSISASTGKLALRKTRGSLTPNANRIYLELHFVPRNLYGGTESSILYHHISAAFSAIENWLADGRWRRNWWMAKVRLVNVREIRVLPLLSRRMINDASIMPDQNEKTAINKHQIRCKCQRNVRSVQPLRRSVFQAQILLYFEEAYPQLRWLVLEYELQFWFRYQ